jgi:hypothetical protein
VPFRDIATKHSNREVNQVSKRGVKERTGAERKDLHLPNQNVRRALCSVQEERGRLTWAACMRIARKAGEPVGGARWPGVDGRLASTACRRLGGQAAVRDGSPRRQIWERMGGYSMPPPTKGVTRWERGSYAYERCWP